MSNDEKPIPARATILREAEALVMGDRHTDYVDPVETHQRIADIFHAITGHDLTPATTHSQRMEPYPRRSA